MVSEKNDMSKAEISVNMPVLWNLIITTTAVKPVRCFQIDMI